MIQSVTIYNFRRRVYITLLYFIGEIDMKKCLLILSAVITCSVITPNVMENIKKGL